MAVDEQRSGSGDGWVTLETGRVVWGRFGAAGMLLCHREAGIDRLLLARRSHWVHGGNGEWSVPGVAIDARPHYDATLSPENDEAAWWALDELDAIPIFQPFAQALPDLMRILALGR